MRKGKTKNNVKLNAKAWAWTISIIVHVFVLGIFAVVKFSQWHEAQKQLATPTAKVSQVKRMVEAEPVSPKPKVRKSIVNCSAVASVDRQLPVKQIFDVPRGILQNPQNISNTARSEPKGLMPLSSSMMVSPKVEFFGSVTEDRKICYVVDCSGSMQGTFGRVQKELIESIEGLDADRYFYVIFFGSGRLYEYGDGRLTRATADAKTSVCEFIKSIRPAGATNAIAAMERAMQIRDGSGAAPAIIYFLTDGFELASDSAYRFAEQVKDVRKNFAPATKINTIGFWVQGWDGRILEKIAKQSGGECTLIEN
jgi:hypothetical protein